MHITDDRYTADNDLHDSTPSKFQLSIQAQEWSTNIDPAPMAFVYNAILGHQPKQFTQATI